MHRLQAVVRLHRLGRSARRIARRIRMGRNTVTAALAALTQDGLLDGAAVLLHLRRVQAIVTDLQAFPPARAQAAPRRALHFGCTEYRGIKGILSQGFELLPLLRSSMSDGHGCSPISAGPLFRRSASGPSGRTL